MRVTPLRDTHTRDEGPPRVHTSPGWVASEEDERIRVRPWFYDSSRGRAAVESWSGRRLVVQSRRDSNSDQGPQTRRRGTLPGGGARLPVQPKSARGRETSQDPYVDRE